MVTKKDIVRIIFDSIDEINEINGSDIPKELNTVLFGMAGTLDSLDFVSLIVSVENKISSQYGKLISLTATKAMSQTQSPFRTVSSLADYTLELLK